MTSNFATISAMGPSTHTLDLKLEARTGGGPEVETALDRASAVPVYLQIRDRLRERILDGTLPPGSALPPERRLAARLAVNRSTVLAAYGALKAEGLIDAHVGRGTVVVARPATFAADRAGGAGAPAPFAWRDLVRRGPAMREDRVLRDLLEVAERRDVISLAVGLPPAELLPLAELREVQERLLAERGSEMLLHSPTEGIAPLRESLAARAAAWGIRATPAEILVTSGSQQGLDLIARVFLDPGDVVVVEQPSYLGALEVFRRAEARLLGVATDGEGMRTDLLEGLLARHRPKLIYTLPTFQNPSGLVMSPARRLALLELARRHQVPIVEDDPYRDLAYDGTPPPPLAALDPLGRQGGTIFVSSTSKVLFPGLRVGWIAAPEEVIHRLALAKQSADLHSGTPGQWIVDRFLREGHLDRHLAGVRPHYSARRDAMLAALAPGAALGLRWARPPGGFYIWCTLPPTVAAGRLLAEAAREGVCFLPGSACFAEESATGHLRLNFTALAPAELREGGRRLLRALAAAHAASASRVSWDGGGAGTRPIV